MCIDEGILIGLEVDSFFCVLRSESCLVDPLIDLIFIVCS